VHGVIFRPIDALNVLCAQLTRDLFATAKFLLMTVNYLNAGAPVNIYLVLISGTLRSFKVIQGHRNWSKARVRFPVSFPLYLRWSLQGSWGHLLP